MFQAQTRLWPHVLSESSVTLAIGRPQVSCDEVVRARTASDAGGMDGLPPMLQRTLRHQDGVVSRKQLTQLGHTPDDLRRWRRRRLLTTWHEGVYVDHTGRPTWVQRAWAAVLSTAPSALFGTSALRAVTGPGLRGHDDAGPIHVAVDHARTLVPPAGVRVHRIRGLEDRVRWDLSPPRMRVEDAVVDMASRARDDFAAVAVVAAAVGGRLTTPPRLLDALDRRGRLARRSFLVGVVEDVRAGECSVLEREYTRRVERPHGLPRGRRQVAGQQARGRLYRDVSYDEQRVYVELDGRLDHTDAADVDADLDRDLEAAVDGHRTVRLGWGQAVGRPCLTAARLALLLQARGWPGEPVRCQHCPG